MSKVTIAYNILERDNWKTREVDDVLAYLKSEYGESFPLNARIYAEHVSCDTDITPTNEQEIERVKNYDGHLFVIHYPQAALAIGAVIAAVVAITASFIMRPKVASTATSGSSKTSSNNTLSDRKNEARIGERVPYHVGTKQIYLDLAMPSYKTLVNGQEVEHAMFCIGQGIYSIASAWEDTTKFTEISGNSMSVFRPGVDVVSGTPDLKYGTGVSENLMITKASTSISDQVLRPINANTLTSENNIYYKYPDSIVTHSDVNNEVDFTNYFDAGDEITISGSNAHYTSDSTGKDVLLPFDGVYKTLSVTSDTVVLVSPNKVNTSWDGLKGITNSTLGSGYIQEPDGSIAANSERWVGYFDLLMDGRTHVLANVRARNGLYRLGSRKGQQFKETVDVTMEVYPLDANGNISGSAETVSGTVEGSAVSRDATGITLSLQTSFTGPCRVRLRRTSQTLVQEKDQYVDTVVLTELYAGQEYSSYVFNDVSIIRTNTYATASAQSVSDRRLNILATRMFREYNSTTSDMNGARVATDDVGIIFCSVCMEPTIGNRTKDEIDFVNIRQTYEQVKSYFGSDVLPRFAYTFDDANVSFEETLNYIASAIGCRPYRRGGKIKLFFEKAVNSHVMLFNHRNKLPSTTKRTITFGNFNDYDGVQLDWQDPSDFDTTQTLYLPTSSPINPKKLEYVGIRSLAQAKMLAYRDWFKIMYQNVTETFTATDEANILLLTEAVLSADTTRGSTIDGEIHGMDGLTLQLSQPFTSKSGVDYSIYLQLSDGSVQSIALTGVVIGYIDTVTLAEAPRLPLVVDSSYYAVTTYQIVPSTHVAARSFLVDELDTQDDFTVNVTLKNNDPRFYQMDKSLT